MSKHKKNLDKSNLNGFTLIELLVVIAIIGLLASIVLAALSTARTQAAQAQAIQNAQELSKALEMYYQDNGSYPTVSSGAPNSVDSTNWGSLATALSPYMQHLPSAYSNSTTLVNYLSLLVPVPDYVYAYTGPSMYIEYSSEDVLNGNPVHCYITGKGYAIYVTGTSPDANANDNGIFPNAYEIYSGDVARGLYHAGYGNTQSTNPSQSCH